MATQCFPATLCLRQPVKRTCNYTNPCHCCALQISELPARELVPGDIVLIHTGDKVPADVRILQLKTAVLRAEQASLTGESVPVNKFTAPVDSTDCELQVGCRWLGASSIVRAPGHATGQL